MNNFMLINSAKKFSSTKVYVTKTDTRKNFLKIWIFPYLLNRFDGHLQRLHKEIFRLRWLTGKFFQPLKK